MQSQRPAIATRWVVIAALLLSFTVHAQIPGPGTSKFEPTIESLMRHRVPGWFEDEKLGVLVTWGIFSVPGYAPPSGELGKVDFKVWFEQNPYAEWYWNTMKIKSSPTWRHHAATYGENFKYEDFIPVFQREARKWNPADWASLFRDAGIRYVVFTAKFADGYPLWPTAVKHPKLPVNHIAGERDYVGDLTTAVRKQGLRMGIYYCGGMDWVFMPEAVKTFMDVFRTIPQSEEYARMADAHWRELIREYKPDILWNDIAYPRVGDAKGIIAEFYNQNKDGAVDNRFALAHSDFLTPEYQKMDKINLKKWETVRGLGYSFGYNQAETAAHMLSTADLIRLLAEIISKNGNLLLGIGPRADGTIPKLQLERLRGLGQWLRTNGDSIYGTRPWVAAEGKTRDGGRIRFTQKGGAVFAIILDSPKGTKLVMDHLVADPATVITVLGRQEKLTWSQEGTAIAVTLPWAPRGDEILSLRIAPLPYALIREPQVSTGTREGFGIQ